MVKAARIHFLAAWFGDIGMAQNKQLLHILQKIIIGGASQFGKSFFYSITQQLFEAIEADYTFIGKLVKPHESRVKTISLFNKNNGFLDNFEYDLDGTPCTDVMGNKVCIYPEDVRRLFPDDELLEQMGIEGYIGVPLYDSKVKPIGILVALFENPILDAHLSEIILRSFANRIAGEMERVELEMQLRLNEEKLFQSEKLRMIGQFASGIAHDFGNQLYGIMGFTELIKFEVQDNPKVLHYVDKVLFSTQHAVQIIQQLLTFSREEQFQQTLIHVHELIKNVIDILSLNLSKKIKINQKLEATSDVVSGDLIQIQNLFLNLGLNAQDAMPDGGNLTFSTKIVKLDQVEHLQLFDSITPGTYLLAEVRDTGIGMSKQVMKKMLEPFFTTKPPEKGTGLGLSTVYGTIQKHKGFINVYSEPQKGSHFLIYFPLQEVSSGLEYNQKPDQKYVHVLVVANNFIMQEYISEVLSSHDIHMTVCPDEQSAIETFEQLDKQIDLVILDEGLTNISNNQLINQLLTMRGDLKIIRFSSLILDKNMQMSANKGRIFLLKKPFSKKELIDTVLKCLNEPQII